MNNIGVLQCGRYAVVVATSGDTFSTSSVSDCLPFGVLLLKFASNYFHPPGRVYTLNEYLKIPPERVHPLNDYLKQATPRAAINSRKIEHFNFTHKSSPFSSFPVEHSSLADTPSKKALFLLHAYRQRQKLHLEFPPLPHSNGRRRETLSKPAANPKLPL